MTLILASFPPDSPPILAADCLVTNSQQDILRPVNLPSERSEEASYVGAQENLVRKLYILRPDLVVLWSGSKVIAEAFLREINQSLGRLRSRPETYEDIFWNVWNSIDECSLKQATNIIGVEYNGTDFNAWCTSDHFKTELPHLGFTLCAGSGAEYFLDIKKKNSYLSRRERADFRNPRLSPARLAIFRAVTVCQTILHAEFFGEEDHLPLNHYFGGHMECCFFCPERKRFLLVNRVLTLFWVVDYSSYNHKDGHTYYFGPPPREEERPDEFSVIRNSYDTNGLVVEKFKNKDKTKSGHTLEREEFKVRNLTPSLNDFDLESNENIVSNIIFVANDTRKEKRPNRNFFMDYTYGDDIQKMVQLSPTAPPLYHLTLNPIIRKILSPHVKDFMARRESSILT